MRRHACILILAALCGGGSYASEKPDALAIGRRWTQLFFAKSLVELRQDFTPAMGHAMQLESLSIFWEQVQAQLGPETKLVSEEVTERDSLQVYRRLAHFEKHAGPIEVVWTVDAAGKAAGFFVRPPQTPAPSPHLDYQTKTPLRLPFDGEWLVFWGGRTLAQNHHVVVSDQRFACDLLVLEDGATHTGDGKTNEQYHGFGKPILAPAAGRVVAAVDSVPDNAPGVMNAAQPLGNYVVLDHGNGEFSFLAHLEAGSVAVRPGALVEAGDALGRCGNSGHSSEPHLHYHMQTTPEFGAGQGLPAQFLNYVANGEAVERGEPVQGQRIRPR